MITQPSPARPRAAPSGHASAATCHATWLPPVRDMPVSATLAANEVMAARRARGEPVLPLASGEAGLPVHPVLRGALAAATTANGYGPVAGQEVLRKRCCGRPRPRTASGAARPPAPEQVVYGPGSKPLLSGLLLAISPGQPPGTPRSFRSAPAWAAQQWRTSRSPLPPAPPVAAMPVNPSGSRRPRGETRVLTPLPPGTLLHTAAEPGGSR
jgi:hypothetical protein